MITAQQVRAGRALLNWSQKELSEHSGISLNAINNFEREIVAPRQDTLFALKRTLEDNGLELIGETGVNKARGPLRIEEFQEGDFAKLLLDDIIAAVRRGLQTVSFHGIDPADLAEAGLDRWEDARRQAGVEEQVLLPYGNFSFASRDKIYRWVSREMIGEVPFVAYGENLALFLGSPPSRLIIIRSRAIAKTFGDQFEIHWAGAKEPSPDQHIRGWEEFHERDWEEAA